MMARIGWCKMKRLIGLLLAIEAIKGNAPVTESCDRQATKRQDRD
jgi:hypothetical protein